MGDEKYAPADRPRLSHKTGRKLADLKEEIEEREDNGQDVGQYESDRGNVTYSEIIYRALRRLETTGIVPDE